MTKKRKVILGVSLLFILIVLLLAVFSRLLISFWARRAIFSTQNKTSKLLGSGKITQHFKEQILVVPHRAGESPFFDNAYGMKKYDKRFFDIYKLDSGENLVYAIGGFEGWEDIPSSDDKYLLVKYPKSGNVGKFRINFDLPLVSDKDALYAEEPTSLQIEVVDPFQVITSFFGKKVNENEILIVGRTAKLGSDFLDRILRRGDAVIAFPVFSPPIRNKRDENGEYLASQVIIRRTKQEAQKILLKD